MRVKVLEFNSLSEFDSIGSVRRSAMGWFKTYVVTGSWKFVHDNTALYIDFDDETDATFFVLGFIK